MSGRQPKRRIAILLEYDGSRYGGSQRQKNAPSIQEALEEAIERLTGAETRLALAGRTDAGVHARGQVAAFTTASRHRTEVFARGLNAWLPEDIAVRNAAEVEERFDPRRHAVSRTYRYLVYNAPARSPLWRDRAWHVAEPLDVEAMGRAGAVLAGQHDFAAFSRREGVPTVRCMRRAEVSREGPLVRLEFEANAFLRHQVRRTAGALVEVGRGKLSVAGFRALLRNAEPATAGPSAPPHGLCLIRVEYPGLDLEGPETV